MINYLSYYKLSLSLISYSISIPSSRVDFATGNCRIESDLCSKFLNVILPHFTNILKYTVYGVIMLLYSLVLWSSHSNIQISSATGHPVYTTYLYIRGPQSSHARTLCACGWSTSTLLQTASQPQVYVVCARSYWHSHRSSSSARSTTRLVSHMLRSPLANISRSAVVVEFGRRVRSPQSSLKLAPHHNNTNCPTNCVYLYKYRRTHTHSYRLQERVVRTSTTCIRRRLRNSRNLLRWLYTMLRAGRGVVVVAVVVVPLRRPSGPQNEDALALARPPSKSRRVCVRACVHN